MRFIKTTKMKFNSFQAEPKFFTNALVKRSLVDPIFNGKTEQREEFIITQWTGEHWLNREPHWLGWMRIPEEGIAWRKPLIASVQSKPPEGVPVIVNLIHDVKFNTSPEVIRAGLRFAIWDEDEWKVHFNSRAIRVLGLDEYNSWVAVPKKYISSWLPLGIKLNYQLRSC